MARIKIRVQDRIATNLTPEIKLVCRNDGYKVEFEFDELWNGSNFKTALFVYNGECLPIVFDGNVCDVPIIENTELLGIGVKSNDINGLHTSTAAKVYCMLSADDLSNIEVAPTTEDVYDQIIELLNQYIAGGGSGIDVTNLQTKVDTNLGTASKEVVGAINEVNEIAKRADENASNGTLALEKATTAEENASVAREKAEIAEEKVDTLDEIAASSLQLASQSFALATEAKTNTEKSVEKTELPNQLYGTDENGDPALYPTDSVGTQVKVDGQKVKEFNADEKFDKIGGVIGGDVSIQGNLSVSGTTTTKDTETLQVKDNVIVANADGVSLVDDSGFAIKTNETDAYGIMYDPIGDGVKIGLGCFTEDGKFVYNEGEAQFLATRADNITDGNLPQWDNDKKQFVDSGEKIGDYVKKTDYATATTAGVVKVNHSNSGMRMVNEQLKLYPASPVSLSLRPQTGVNYNETSPITVGNLNISVIAAFTDDKKILMTDEEKTKACETIGALPNKKPTNSNNGDGFLITFGTDGKTIGYKRLYGSYVDEPYSVPYRDGNGVIHGKIPTTDTGLTPKVYVDNLPDYLTEEQKAKWQGMVGADIQLDTDGTLTAVGGGKAYTLESGDDVTELTINLTDNSVGIDKSPLTLNDGLSFSKIDWGDGTISTDNSIKTHTYLNSGTYTIRLWGIGKTISSLLIAGQKHFAEQIRFGKSVTSIDNEAFDGYYTLKEVHLHNNIVSIGANAFKACRALRTIKLPDFLVTIGNFAFLACAGLTSITIPKSVTNFGTKVFSSCTSLETVTIERDFDVYAYNEQFYNCTALSKIIVPYELLSSYQSTWTDEASRIDAICWASKATKWYSHDISITDIGSLRFISTIGRKITDTLVIMNEISKNVASFSNTGTFFKILFAKANSNQFYYINAEGTLEGQTIEGEFYDAVTPL